MMYEDMMYGRTKSKDDIQTVVKRKLEALSYLPVYASSDTEHRIRKLQDEDLYLRKSKRFTLDRGVEMLKEIDDINDELKKSKKEYQTQQEEIYTKQQAGIPEEVVEALAAARKRKKTVRPKRKIIKHKKKITKRR